MGAKLITAPAVEPVSVDDAKAMLGITGTAQDALVTMLTKSARAWVEKYLGRALITQTWELSLDEFPCRGSIELLPAPIQSVTSLKYDDAAGVETTVDSADYYLDNKNDFEAWLVPVGASTWAYSTLDAVNAVRVRYVAGYGDTADDVPDPIKEAILRLVTLKAPGVGIQSSASLRSESVEGVGSWDYQISSITAPGVGGVDQLVANALGPYRIFA